MLAPGRIACAGVELDAATGELPVGSEILWCVRPERLLPAAAGALSGVVTDAIDVGLARELTVTLGGELDLLLRTSDRFEARVGEPLRLALAADDVSVWPSDAGPRDPTAGPVSG